jgi:hypothetical protein
MLIPQICSHEMCGVSQMVLANNNVAFRDMSSCGSVRGDVPEDFIASVFRAEKSTSKEKS